MKVLLTGGLLTKICAAPTKVLLAHSTGSAQDQLLSF